MLETTKRFLEMKIDINSEKIDELKSEFGDLRLEVYKTLAKIQNKNPEP